MYKTFCCWSRPKSTFLLWQHARFFFFSFKRMTWTDAAGSLFSFNVSALIVDNGNGNSSTNEWPMPMSMPVPLPMPMPMPMPKTESQSHGLGAVAKGEGERSSLSHSRKPNR